MSRAFSSKPRQVAIVSYGTGNIASLVESFAAIGAEAFLAGTPEALRQADALVLPGVGHFGAAMEALHHSGLLAVLQQRILEGLPTLGICLGFQILTASSEEAPGVDGLGLLPSSTVRLRPPDTRRYKVPHLGWNTISSSEHQPRLLRGIDAAKQIFYFANAFGVLPGDTPEASKAYYQHGQAWLALLEQGNVYGVQFHPEKSRRQGLQILSNFLGS